MRLENTSSYCLPIPTAIQHLLRAIYQTCFWCCGCREVRCVPSSVRHTQLCMYSDGGGGGGDNMRDGEWTWCRESTRKRHSSQMEAIREAFLEEVLSELSSYFQSFII